MIGLGRSEHVACLLLHFGFGVVDVALIIELACEASDLLGFFLYDFGEAGLFGAKVDRFDESGNQYLGALEGNGDSGGGTVGREIENFVGATRSGYDNVGGFNEGTNRSRHVQLDALLGCNIAFGAEGAD